MITGIDSKTPPPDRPIGKKLIEHIEQQPDVHIEVLEKGYDSVTSMRDIVPMTDVYEVSDSDAKQILLQIISIANGAEVFGVVAVRCGNIDALMLTRMGDGKERALPIALITDTEPIKVGRSHTVVDGRPLAESLSKNHFQIGIDPLGNIDIRDLSSTNGTEVLTALKDDNDKSRGAINRKTVQRFNNVIKRSTFAPPLPNPLEDDNYWASNPVIVEQLLEQNK